MTYHSATRIVSSWVAIVFAATVSGCAWLPFGDAHRNQLSQELNEKARVSEEEGNLQQATQSLHEATQVDPADVAARLNLARLHREAGRTKEAIEALREVVALTPDDAKAWAELGELEFRVGSEVAANESLEQALRYNPQMISALMLKAELEEMRQYDDEALELYHRALALDPYHAPAMLKIARIQMRQNEPMRAALLLRRMCHCRGVADEDIAEARWLLGLAYGQQQRWEDASASLQIALELAPRSGPADFYYLAYAQYRAGQLHEATQTALVIQQRDPQFAPAQALLRSTATMSAKPTGTILPAGSSTPPTMMAAIPAPPGWESLKFAEANRD